MSKRIVLSVAALVLMLCGCGRVPEVSSSPPAGRGEFLPPVQEDGRPKITTEKITHDIVGQVVQISELSGEGPTADWAFEADEYRRIEILQQRKTDSGVAVEIFITTTSNPQPDEPSMQVSGKLRLYYDWVMGRWALAGIENLTFRYSLGLST